MRPSLIMSIMFCTFLSNKYQFPICILELISWFCYGPSGHSCLKWVVLLKAIHFQKLQTIMKPPHYKSMYCTLCLNFSYQYTYNHAIDYWRKKIKLIGILNVFKHVLKINSDNYFFSNLTLPLVDSTVAMTMGKIYIGFMHTQDTHSQGGLDNNSIISS